MSAPSILSKEDGYVPVLQVTAPGGATPLPLSADVVEVSYVDSLESVGSFALTLDNRDQRYSGARALAPGTTLELWLGYRGQVAPVRVATGEITALRVGFPVAGHPTLTVTALDLLHRLRGQQRTRVFENRTDTQIARRVASELGVPIHTAPRGEQPYPYLVQDNEYDVVFLLRLARRIGYELWVDEQGRLRFEPPPDRGAGVHELVWGSSLVEFDATLSTARQVGQVVVRAWDQVNKKPITATARRRGGGEAVRSVSSTDVVTAVVSGPQEAHRIAEARLGRITAELIRASGSTAGTPRLRAGCLVSVRGVGKWFAGRYFVTATHHRVDRAGYRTSFECRGPA